MTETSDRGKAADPHCEPDPDRPEISFVFVHSCFDYVGVEAETQPVVRRTALPLGEMGWSWVGEPGQTITPSIQCGRCGTHGFWRDGSWQKAP